MCQEIEHPIFQKIFIKGDLSMKRKYTNKFIAFFLTLVMVFSLTTPAFAANTTTSSQIAAAKQAFEYLTPEQQNAFIKQIEKIAWSGDTSLVEFHHNYVDPTYTYDPATATPPIQTRAADVAGQLQALNLPSVVYYALLAFATSLGVPVGNVVDLVIGLGLGIIIIANWNQIKDVWSDIVDIFVNAFGSVVNDAFDYIEGLINGSKSIKSSDIDWDAGDKNHIMRGTKDKHVEGFKKFGFDPKDPNNWTKLLPILKEVVDNPDSTKGPSAATGGGTFIQYFKYYAKQGVEVMVKIFFPENGGTPRISDAIPYIK